MENVKTVAWNQLSAEQQARASDFWNEYLEESLYLVDESTGEIIWRNVYPGGARIVTEG